MLQLLTDADPADKCLPVNRYPCPIPSRLCRTNRGTETASSTCPSTMPYAFNEGFHCCGDNATVANAGCNSDIIAYTDKFECCSGSAAPCNSGASTCNSFVP